MSTISKVNNVDMDMEEIEILFNALPSEIWQSLVNCFNEADFESEESNHVLNYFISNSMITKLVNECPSSALIFEFLYQKRKPELPIDKYFVNTKAARAIYERLQALKKELPDIIRKEIKRQDWGGEEFRILNIGSGPSHEMIEILSDDLNQDLRQKIKVLCVDPDESALKIGQELVKKKNLEENFIFIPKKLNECRIEYPANMLLMVGILCPVSSKNSKKILRNLAISHFLTFNSAVVFSTVQEIMREEDSLCDYIMRLTGWKMDYKGDIEPSQIAVESGWKPIYHFFDKFKFNRMTVAILNLKLKRKILKFFIKLFNS